MFIILKNKYIVLIIRAFDYTFIHTLERERFEYDFISYETRFDRTMLSH